MPDKELASQLGVHPATVFDRRIALGIPSHRPHAPVTPPRDWTKDDDALLGTMPDSQVVARLGCTPAMVRNRRGRLGVLGFPR